MFIWRFAHDSLAVRVNLVKRGVPIEDDRCLLCSSAREDGAHLFIQCQKVQEVWRKLGLEEVRTAAQRCATGQETMDLFWLVPEQKRLKLLLCMVALVE